MPYLLPDHNLAIFPDRRLASLPPPSSPPLLVAPVPVAPLPDERPLYDTPLLPDTTPLPDTGTTPSLAVGQLKRADVRLSPCTVGP
jgi:hypothetical protein